MAPLSLSAMPRPTKTYHMETYDRISKHHGFEGDGKTVLVTGGASGVGYSISKAFAEAGVKRIALLGRSPGPLDTAKTELEKAHPSVQVLTYQASVTDHTRINQIVQELGAIDILVHNAAIAHRRAEATEITGQEMQDAFETNVFAVFNLSKAFLALPKPASGRKTIINVSAAAINVYGPHRVAYGSSKAAGVQVMQNFAAQFKVEDVAVFSFHPGSFYTPGVAENIPKDMIQWEDINLPAHFSLWLAGSESDFLHGRFVWAQWDVDELIQLKEKLAKDRTCLTVGLLF